VYEGTSLPPGSNGIPNDGTGKVTFEATPVATPKSKTFTVKNVGTANLVLVPPIALPPGFTLDAGFDKTTLVAGDTATLAVALNAAVAGRLGGALTFGINEPTKKTFSMTLIGPSLAPPSLVILNDGSADFSTVGTWTTPPQQGFQGDLHASDSGAVVN